MFKMAVKSWWNGDAARERLLAEKKAGLRALAYYVADVARRLAPVDTGELRDSIQVIGEADGLRLHIFATAPHAEPVEFGYRHWISGRQIPAQPFMRMALNDGARAMPQFLGGTRVRQGYHRGALMGATFE